MSDGLDEWLDPVGTLLVLAPHPDDDVLGCARLMQRAVAMGVGLVVVWLTDGGASHGALSPAERDRLTARRHDEALAGLRALGVAPVECRFLDHPDGQLDRFRQEARTRLERLCQRHGVGTVAVTDKDDGHPDHRAAHAIAALLPVERLLAYPVSTRFDGHDYAPPTGALLLPAAAGDAKRAALLEHRSQMEETAIVPMTLATIERFCGEPEIFLPARKVYDVG